MLPEPAAAPALKVVLDPLQIGLLVKTGEAVGLAFVATLTLLLVEVQLFPFVPMA